MENVSSKHNIVQHISIVFVVTRITNLNRLLQSPSKYQLQYNVT